LGLSSSGNMLGSDISSTERGSPLPTAEPLTHKKVQSTAPLDTPHLQQLRKTLLRFIPGREDGPAFFEAGACPMFDIGHTREEQVITLDGVHPQVHGNCNAVIQAGGAQC
jgi:hypothetical protein